MKVLIFIIIVTLLFITHCADNKYYIQNDKGVVVNIKKGKNDIGYFTDQYGEVNFYNIETYRVNANNASNGRQLKRLLALNQLLNIAEYYNNIHPK